MKFVAALQARTAQNRSLSACITTHQEMLWEGIQSTRAGRGAETPPPRSLHLSRKALSGGVGMRALLLPAGVSRGAPRLRSRSTTGLRQGPNVLHGSKSHHKHFRHPKLFRLLAASTCASQLLFEPCAYSADSLVPLSASQSPPWLLLPAQLSRSASTLSACCHVTWCPPQTAATQVRSAVESL